MRVHAWGWEKEGGKALLAAMKRSRWSCIGQTAEKVALIMESSVRGFSQVIEMEEHQRTGRRGNGDGSYNWYCQDEGAPKITDGMRGFPTFQHHGGLLKAHIESHRHSSSSSLAWLALHSLRFSPPTDLPSHSIPDTFTRPTSHRTWGRRSLTK